MQEVALLVLLATLGSKLVDFTKALSNREWNTALTNLYAWAIGIVLLFLASQADIFEGFILPGMSKPVTDLGLASIVILGASMLSLLGVAYDFKKALDGSDSAKTSPLTSMKDGNKTP